LDADSAGHVCALKDLKELKFGHGWYSPEIFSKFVNCSNLELTGVKVMEEHMEVRLQGSVAKFKIKVISMPENNLSRFLRDIANWEGRANMLKNFT
jgi:hypothetical protein